MLWMSCQLICRFVFHLMCSNTADLTAIASPTADSLNWISEGNRRMSPSIFWTKSPAWTKRERRTPTQNDHDNFSKRVGRFMFAQYLAEASVNSCSFMLYAYSIRTVSRWRTDLLHEFKWYVSRMNTWCYLLGMNICYLHICIYIYLLLIIVYLYVQLYACSGVSRDSRVTFSGLPWGVACWRSGYDSKKNFERYL